MPAPETHAFWAPLLLFAHGILDWVDSIGGAGGPLWVAAQVALVASMLGFGGLALGLARPNASDTGETGETGAATVAERRVAMALVAVGGVGVAGAAMVRLVDGPTTQAPLPITLVASVLVGAGLVLLLGMVARHLLPAGALVILGLAALTLALPWDLLPLGALLTLIGLGPLTRPADPIDTPQTVEREQPVSTSR